MRFVIQRVKHASVTVDGNVLGKIEKGFMVLIGVCETDDNAIADKMVKKLVGLRIFEDENGKINKSILDVDGEILFVSQFTLMANASHGNRPDFLAAESPDRANEIYLYTAEGLKKAGLSVKLGVFGADMKIMQVSDGPFTVILEK